MRRADHDPKRLRWSTNKVSLIETARVRVDLADVELLADTYKMRRRIDRSALTTLSKNAAESTAAADQLAWITSHIFRKTTATILDDAGPRISNRRYRSGEQ